MSAPEQQPIYTAAKTTGDLQGILDLQAQNLPAHISQDEAQDQGFVTLQHDLALLQAMNSPHPHSIAKLGDQVIGYALVMAPHWEARIPALTPMFQQIEQAQWHGRPINADQFVIMGQVCVAKAWRSQGVFGALYEHLCAGLKGHFPFLITEIASHNTRSLRAHEKVGFAPWVVYADGPTQWHIVLRRL
ncbi:GNAT family N-acetyltransferase [Marinicella meishanensis]|uniref:GNAT family N-acetyltransferase n=1 Tax=Marinicella meishanensis TaxID=2873263 RepID=UPI001CBD8C6F|nr:GNAT family N-acetyltransferase [Marinicella sp. NBU2979]